MSKFNPKTTDLETTVEEAQLDAPNARVAQEIGTNAKKEQDAAVQAAAVAKTLGSNYTGEPTTAVDQFKHDASKTTNNAVAQGKHDIDAAKATTAGYVDQAKAYANSALEAAQSYLPASVTGGTASNIHSHQPSSLRSAAPSEGQGILSSTQGTMNVAIEKAEEYLHTAKEVVQPHIEKVVGTAGTAGGYLGVGVPKGEEAAKKGTSATPASSTGIPATSAPLESGPYKVNNPYPSTTSKVGTNIAANEGQATVS